MEDPYWKLRPEEPTPADEICNCPGSLPIVLQDHLSPVPLACISCNGEVPPERIGFSAQTAEKLAFWRNFHRAFLHLWLDSREYETWAREQLEDPEAPVNTRGLAVAREINPFRRIYYWWFQHDTTHEDFEPLSNCPRCVSSLEPLLGRWVCERCSIVVANGGLPLGSVTNRG